MGQRPAAGQVLVATPSLADPNFTRTVVLILEHGEDGALGVVVNRPTEVTIEDTLPGWDRLAADPPVVFLGGPVEQEALIAVARLAPGEADGPADWQPVTDALGVVDLDQDPMLVPELAEIRVFAGYAGWAPGQLDAEISSGSWFVLDAEPHDPFAPDAEALWRGVVRRQGGVFSTFPPDPSHN